MAETIRVVVRFRGNEDDLQDNPQNCWNFSPNEKSLLVPQAFANMKINTLNTGNAGDKDRNSMDNNFTFDHVLDHRANQEKMYRVCAQETISQLMKGYNGTIFAFGQSGSGKTYTMLGPDEVVEVIKKGISTKDAVVPLEIQGLYGIIPRAIYDIFKEINKQIEIYNSQFEIKINYFEIYNESLNNLLATNPQAQHGLKLREQKNGSIIVLNCDPIYVTTPEELFSLLMIGQRSRSIASTNQNERSSRSHTILVLDYVQKNPDGSMKSAKLNLVDLAGSERIAKTGATGKTLEEAKKINLSLTTLGICIKNLTEGKTHVPFRDSKLTFFLKESLGGNSKTTLICTASKKMVHLEESVQTLKFAQRAKKIKNKAVSNVMRSPKEMEQLIQKLKVEVQQLKKKLIEMGINPQTLNLQQISSLEEQSKQLDNSLELDQQTFNNSIKPNEVEESSIIPAQEEPQINIKTEEEQEDEIQDHQLLKELGESNQQQEDQKSLMSIQITTSTSLAATAIAQSITKQQLMEVEDLNLKLTELQNEYEHYKEYADTRIMELEDQIERLNKKSESKEELQNQIQGFKFIVADKEEQIKKVKKTIEKERQQLQGQIQTLENQVQTKDAMIKELEADNENLRVKLEKEGFELFCKIKNELQKDSISNFSIGDILTNEGSALEKIIEQIQEEIKITEQKYFQQEQSILKLQEENSTLKIKLQQKEFFQQIDPTTYAQIQLNTSYSQTEIMSVHSQQDDSQTQQQQLSSQQSQEEERKSRDQLQTIKDKSSFLSGDNSKKTINNGVGGQYIGGFSQQLYFKENSLSNRQSINNSNHSGSSYNTRRGSTFKPFGYNKINKQKLLDLTIDNIKLVQTNAKLLSLLKAKYFQNIELGQSQTKPKQNSTLEQIQKQLQQFESKTIQLESQLKEKQFQIIYLEKLATNHASIEKDECNHRNEKIQKLDQDILALKLEVQQLKGKNIDLEEECQQLKKTNQELKKEKNLYKLDSAKVIRNSVNQIMQNNYQQQRRGGIVRGGVTSRGIIKSKVLVNEDILSGKIFEGVESPLKHQENTSQTKEGSRRSSIRDTSDFFGNSRYSGVAQTNVKQQNQQILLKQSVDLAFKNHVPNLSFRRGPYGGGQENNTSSSNLHQGNNSGTSTPLTNRGSQFNFAGGSQGNLFQQIMPIYDGIVKTMGQSDNLRELNDLLNGSDDDDDDDSEEEIIRKEG